MAAYGLAPPDSTVIIEGEGEPGTETIFIGGYNPTKTAVYARKDGSPEVVLLGYNVKYYEDLIFQAAQRGYRRAFLADGQSSAADRARRAT